MGRASSSKKVARAASTGGGRTARGARPLGWYAAIAAVTILGIAGIAFSRAEYRQELAAGADGSAPVANQDHWHAAYGIYACDEFLPALTDERDPKGIHSHADGIIHIHPFVRSAAGRNATLSVFADAAGLELSDTRIQIPGGGKTYKAGDTKCDGKDAIVQVKVNEKKVVTEEVGNIKLNDGDLVTIAFAPKGAELPAPPSAGDLARLDPQSDEIIPEGGATTTVPGAAGDTSTTAPAAGGTAETTTTAAP
jgi:hypothetical protein